MKKEYIYKNPKIRFDSDGNLIEADDEKDKECSVLALEILNESNMDPNDPISINKYIGSYSILIKELINKYIHEDDRKKVFNRVYNFFIGKYEC
jgi:hypothetical protein